jgi:hypothetical protein
MKLLNRISLVAIATIALFSCSSSEDQFIGTWANECEDEVMGLKILPQKELLTLNDDNSFVQSFTYFADSQYDTLAVVSVNGSWELVNNCLEMNYDTESIVVKCDDEDIIDIFYDNLLGNVALNNEELEKAHEEDSQYGIQNAAVKDNSLISKENLEDEDGEVIYTKVN